MPNVPQVEYQDLGLTLKATPRVMRNDEVSLSIDLKIDALSGTSINGNPILDNRAYSGVVMLKKGESVVVAGELDKSQMRAISGVPGFSEIPGTERRDRQQHPEQLFDAADHHDAPRRSRNARSRPLADDAGR